MLDEATKLLLENQNADGGWGAVAGKRSATEATALAFLALRSRDQKSLAPAIERSKQWLVERQNGDGSWPVADGFTGSSWSTAFAMLALSDSQDARDRVINAGLWALEQKGSKPGLLVELIFALGFQKRATNLNPDLIGWSWTPRSFSWVEPTSYFIMALKKLKLHLPQKTFQQRVEQGELMIYDRMCEGGGWNYGNASVLGEVLTPFPDVTAVALIALQDHPEREENRMSLTALDRMAKETGSGLALSWSVICYRLYGKESAPLARLLEQQFAKTRFLGETKTIALAILAMENGAEYFRI
jgi:hypothetical protein